jgi:hypothetical protein
MKTMIDFSKCIELDKISKLLSSLTGNTDNTQYFDVGRMIELGYEAYSNGNLKRVNLTGRDLIDLNQNTYESKRVTFVNNSERDVRNIVVKNGRGKSKDISDFTPADYYIFSDPKKLKACCVPGSMLYNIKKSGSNDLTAFCDPEPEHFFLDGGPTSDKNYFDEKDKLIMNFIRSM